MYTALSNIPQIDPEIPQQDHQNVVIDSNANTIDLRSGHNAPSPASFITIPNSSQLKEGQICSPVNMNLQRTPQPLAGVRELHSRVGENLITEYQYDSSPLIPSQRVGYVMCTPQGGRYTGSLVNFMEATTPNRPTVDNSQWLHKSH